MMYNIPGLGSPQMTIAYDGSSLNAGVDRSDYSCCFLLHIKPIANHTVVQEVQVIFIIT